MSYKQMSWRRRRAPLPLLLAVIALFAVIGLLVFDLSSIDSSSKLPIKNKVLRIIGKEEGISANRTLVDMGEANAGKKCVSVEEMGEIFSRGYTEETIRVRRAIRAHFDFNGASRVREFHPEEFCNHGFVIGKASEAGLGNELYKILTAGALSVMLNRSLIIGQTRGAYPFGDYISYSNISFTLKEVKHLWKKNLCLTKYGRHLTMRIDDFQKPKQTDVLCSNWREWEQPIIWFQNTTDAVAAQFFLKNIHPEMKEAALGLFGSPDNLQYRANVFGELMRILISPSRDVKHALNWALNGGKDPDIALHLRMMNNKSPRAKQAVLECISKAVRDLQLASKPKVVMVSDTPAMLRELAPSLQEVAQVLHFDYEQYEGNISGSSTNKHSSLSFRVKDWGPAPRWVAFVDFFLASRAKHAVISGAHRRVGTTYVQLIAALAAAYRLDESISIPTGITFLSSFQSNLVSDGLGNQIGWGHVWNRFAGPLSCHNQANQCAPTPLLPPAWWDGVWQSPIPRDIQRLEAYGIKLSALGTFDEGQLKQFCSSKRHRALTIQLI